MAKSRIPLITFAIVGILMLGLQSLLVNPRQEAWALSRPTVNTGFNNVQFTKYVPSTGSTQYLAVGNFSSYTIKIYNANNTNLINTFSVKSVTPTDYSVDNVSCDKSGASQLCAVAWTGATSLSGVYLFDAGKAITQNNNTRFTIGATNVPVVSLFNDGSITHVYLEYRNVGLAQTHVIQLAINTTGSLTTTSNRLVNQADVISNVDIASIGNADTATVTSGANAGNWIMFMNTGSVNLWSVAQAKRTCGFNLPAGSVGDIDYVSDKTGQYFLVSNQISTLYTVDLACANALATNFSPKLTNIYSISHSASRNEIYLVGDTNSLLVVNETTLSSTVLAQYSGFTSPGIHFNNMATADAYYNSPVPTIPFTVIGGGGNPASLYFFYWNGVGSGSPSGTGNLCGSTAVPPHCVGSVNCDLPQNANLVMCFVTNGNGTNAFNNGVSLLNNTNSVIAQGIGLSNQNIKTNGVGYLYLVLALILANGGWLLIVHSFGTKGIVVPQPIFVSAILSFALIISFVMMGITDPLILIIGIVALVAFTAPKAITMIRGGGGESQVAS